MEGINPRFAQVILIRPDSLLRRRCNNYWYWRWRCRCCWWLERLLRSPSKRVPSKSSRKAWTEGSHPERINLVGDSNPSALIQPILLPSRTHLLLALMRLLLQLFESSVWRPSLLHCISWCRHVRTFLFFDKNER